jgi:DNA-binding transcriptional LysR family regulator
VLAIPSNHRWAKKEKISIHEVSEEPFISRELGSGTLRKIEDSLQAAGLGGLDAIHLVARLGTSTAVKEGIKAGLGVSILSARALDTELKTGVLKALKIEDLPLSRRFYLIRDRRRVASPLCQAMVDFLLETSKEA